MVSRFLVFLFVIFTQADAVKNERNKIRTPMQYENLRGTMHQGSPNTFDGLRVAVQKQVNLNTVVSHL